MTVAQLRTLIAGEPDDLEIIVKINEFCGPEYAELAGYLDMKHGKLLLISTMIMDDNIIYLSEDTEHED